MVNHVRIHDGLTTSWQPCETEEISAQANDMENIANTKEKQRKNASKPFQYNESRAKTGDTMQNNQIHRKQRKNQKLTTPMSCPSGMPGLTPQARSNEL